MKSFVGIVLLIVITVALFKGYYSSISGTVVDNITGKPIEGALVVAQWTKPRGIPGMHYSNLHRITETLSDKKGKFHLRGTIGVIINRPVMLVYKDGYIPWRNDSTFPSLNAVKNNEWKNCVTYKLDVLTDKYTIVQLSDFTRYGFMIEGLNKVPIFDKLHGNLEHREGEWFRQKK
jgi:hypothetical protein